MANIRRMTRKRLGELLLQEGLVSEEQLETALEEQKQTGELIGEILVRKGYVNEAVIAKTISVQFSFPYLAVNNYYITPDMRGVFSLETLEKHCFVPIDKFGDVLGVVIAGLLDQDVVDEIEKHSGCAIQVYVGKVSEVKQVIKERFAAASPQARAAEVKPSKEGRASGVDVTAPPKMTVVTKKKGANEDDSDVVDLSEAIVEEGAAPDAAKSDEAVVKELEQQFKKFRFFDEDGKGKPESGEKKEEK
jgi:hypothetical protein